ncbi:pyrroline-5-carboxylate reductase [Enemella sp. A6]|uniref:pyrroline-5-carboxylate reductase n=1 Tax=Enemella sp. A6 TaxID=3440152 RepID=UPI003EC06117
MAPTPEHRIAILGAGVMGETLLAALLRDGWQRSQLTICERRADRLDELTEVYRVSATSSAVEAVADATVVAVVVKPADAVAVLAEVAPHLRPGTLVVSLAAGVGTARYEAAIAEAGGPSELPVIRVMPNTPAVIGAGVAAVSKGSHATDDHLNQVAALLSGMGEVVTVDEKDQDAVTALSGSGPAYVFAFIDAMIEGGVMMGLTREVATTLAVQTVLGSATLARDTGDHPVLLRERVTSPGGTTAAGLHVLDARAMRAAVAEAMVAARDRSRELSGD